MLILLVDSIVYSASVNKLHAVVHQYHLPPMATRVRCCEEVAGGCVRLHTDAVASLRKASWIFAAHGHARLGVYIFICWACVSITVRANNVCSDKENIRALKTV